jgi:hypothetical protein
VVDAVGDHDVVARCLRDHVGQQQEPQRLGEPRVDAVHQPALAGTDPPPLRDEVRLQLDELVVGGVGDEERAHGQLDGLAGEPQRRGRFRRGDVGAVAAVQRAGGLVLGHQLLDQHGEPVRVPLPGHLRHDVAGRVDDGQGRPRPRRVGVPRGELGIVEHRVVDAVTLHRGLDGVRVGLVHELRRVDPDRHQHVGEPLLQLTQLVDHVQAVHAAERPEVEQHDLPAQRGEGQRLASGVQPATPREFRRPYP